MVNTSLNTSNLNFTNIRKPVFASKLNLVALMDIFTILVFFLLLNSGDANELENAKFVKLPDSSAKAAPHVDASIIIGEEDIWLNNEVIISVDDALSSDKKLISPLAEALKAYTEKKETLTSYEKANGLAVTIMGDKSVSYSLLERVMTTCSSENFRDISLAVNRVEAPTIFSQPGNQPTALETNNLGGG